MKISKKDIVKYILMISRIEKKEPAIIHHKLLEDGISSYLPLLNKLLDIKKDNGGVICYE